MIGRFLLVALVASVAFSLPAATRKTAVRKTTPAPRATVQAKGPVQSAHRRDPYVGAISADVKTGKVLFEDCADAEAYPASVTKLMTALLVLEDVKAGKYGFADRVTATPEAYYSESSWVGIKAGQSMTVDDPSWHCSS